MSTDLRIYEPGAASPLLDKYAPLTFLQVIVNEETAQDTAEFITKRLSAIKNQRSTGELEDLALVIGKLFKHRFNGQK